MRKLIALTACCLAFGAAGANEPPTKIAGVQPSSPARADAMGVGDLKGRLEKAAKGGKPVRKLSEREQEEEAEAALSARIAERLAQMKANQAARHAAAARARKAAQAAQATKAAYTVPQPAPANGTFWTYEGEFGPANWSKINAAWNKCNGGERQSPIDIRDGIKVDLEQISFEYRPSGFTVTDNGHTVQVALGAGNYLSVGGRSYELQQLHFHRPAEERVNGKTYEMGIHLVHKDTEGRTAVLALMLQRGRAQPAIQTVWNNLPLEKKETSAPSIVFNPGDLLPERRDYYTYMGSLSEPPCTEGVLWLVMKEPLQASGEQMALFSRLYPLNARPVQAAAGRLIKESQ
ncbi:carbonic anhydrase [Pseudoduganella lutea]|uniref:carbonic anhydrase n=1 Tax=Pseudoduganella lutea TaxID=321985 RepID=A0A4P6L0X4_9BURK|nr:carbonic anhydrase family protein [Pseudoduganella lutea]QBE64532.1 carbonic anhydrase family protein [Pseudoduganella lutea]